MNVTLKRYPTSMFNQPPIQGKEKSVRHVKGRSPTSALPVMPAAATARV